MSDAFLGVEGERLAALLTTQVVYEPQLSASLAGPPLVALETLIEDLGGSAVGDLQEVRPILREFSGLRGSRARIYTSHCSRLCCATDAARRCWLQEDSPATSEPPAFPGVSMPLLIIGACAMNFEHRRLLSASVLPTSVGADWWARISRRIAIPCNRRAFHFRGGATRLDRCGRA
jgi:hypothetical protein